MTLEKLPPELEEEILIRVPPLSLARFKTVCKQWYALLNDNRFVKNHLALARACPKFIVTSKSKIYSINVNFDENPNIKKREISFKIPGLESLKDPSLYHCDGLLISTWKHGATVWNPWLRQSRWIEPKGKIHGICGIGYDSSRPERSYKIVGYTYHWVTNFFDVYARLFIYDFATNSWKDIDVKYNEYLITKQPLLDNVSLSGNLYWVAYYRDTGEYFIQSLDCSREILKPFCILPCKKKDFLHSYALSVFKGDRLSLLEQCEETGRIEIWVTKDKISSRDNVEGVVWIKFMTVSIPNFPILYNIRNMGSSSSSSYFVDNNIYGKSFVVCCREESREACIYIVRGDVCKKITLDFVVDQFCNSVYVPSLIPPLLE